MSDIVRTNLSILLGIKIDPVGKWDTATIAGGLVFFTITLTMIIYAWVHRKYPPIRSKNINVIIIMYIGALFWFIGDIPVNGHVELVGVWSVCKLWSVWFRVFFSYTFSAAIGIRIYALYRIFILRRPYKGLSYYLPIVIVFACLVLFSLVSTLISDRVTATYRKDVHFCTYVWGFRGACLGLLWFIWFIILVLIIKIRNIHSSFNERYESIIICILALVAIGSNTLLHILRPNYPLQMHLRVANTWIDFLCSNIGMWTIILYPIIQCMFNREQYLDYWTKKLRSDGLGKEYDISQQKTNPSSGYCKMESDTASKDISYDQTCHLTLHGTTVRDSIVIHMESCPTPKVKGRRII
ncbi:hypothetical protein GGI12_002015 [Dipsacomyces acuminosporus]|nr:hypothetical protein GGI12_002015 [Dipsacomyces acuminosporus]